MAQSGPPINVGLVVEQISLPTFYDHGGNLGYGLNIGSEFNYTTKERTELIQTVDSYFFTHENYGSSLVLASLFGFRYKPGRFNADLKLGPGFMVFHNYSPIYQEEDGTYRERANIQAKFSVISSVVISYRIQNFKPFISYGLLLESPFINSSSGLLPHQLIGVGCAFNLKNR